MLEGKNKWTRPALVAYWALLISLSVAGWTRQLARSKRRRQWNARGSMQTPNGMMTEMSSAPTSPRYGIMPGQSGYSATIQSAPQQSASVGAGGSPASPTELSDPAAAAPGEGIASYGIRLPNLPDMPNANLANVATDLLDAADKRVPTLSVNARRKFFHALAVVMFVPGIAVDVSAPVSDLVGLCSLVFMDDLIDGLGLS